MKWITQIEISSRCNLKCPYCIHPTMKRDKIDMDVATFHKSLDWIEYLYKDTKDKDLWLHGIGESLLNVDFLVYCQIARRRFPDLSIKWSTNAVALESNHIQVLKELKIPIHISLHRPDKAYKGYFEAMEAGIVEFVGINPLSGPMDWAGQVKFPNHNTQECGYIKNQNGVINAQGNILSCCYDANEVKILANVHDEPRDIPIEPYDLCKTCGETY